MAERAKRKLLADRPLAEFAHERLKRLLKTFRRAIEGARRHPDGKATVHDLRVAIRRLRESVKAFEGFIVTDDAHFYEHELQKLMHACAPVRDYEVTIELLKQAEADKKLIRHLREGRQREQSALKAAVKRWGKSKASRPLRAASEKDAADAKRPDGIRWDQRSARANAHRHLPALVDAWHTEGRLAVMPAAADIEQHGFRIQTKRLRYLLELFQVCYGPAGTRRALKRILRRLGTIQDHLGAMHDCVVALEHVEDPALIARLRALLETRKQQFRVFWARRIDADWPGGEAWLEDPHNAAKAAVKSPGKQAR